MAGDDWEEKMLDQLERLLSNMGMNMSREQLRALLQQFRAQFEKMGIDEERIAKGDVNFNFDLSNLQNFFQPGMDFNELFKNMGVDVRVDASPVEIETPEGDDQDDMILPADDVYLEGWNMTITVDFAKKELEQDQVELNLVDGGSAAKASSGGINRKVMSRMPLLSVKSTTSSQACGSSMRATGASCVVRWTSTSVPPSMRFNST